MKTISSLKSLINLSLKEGEMIKGFENALLSLNKTQVLNKDESEFWDYKEDIDLSQNNDIAKLAKFVMGFHNLKGGVLIFGISDDFKIKGFSKNKTLDNIRIRSKIKKYLSKEVLIFQNQIEINTHKVIWLIFVPPRRKEPPVQVNIDYSDSITSKKILSKHHYIIRDGDQFKSCTDPFDYERCFSDLNHSHLYAYLYDIDEPYYRLLAPHQDRFFGRIKIIEKIMKTFNSRSYIIVLDGLGGVGKSAIAIEFVKKLYESKSYDFIISLSAKNRVWEGKISSRQAGFSGLYEMVVEIAKVLQIDIINKSLDELKKEIVEGMEGLKGIILIDNLETVKDAEVISFLNDEVPEPVKILITSKVTKDLDGRIISIPEMEKSEALELLYFELQKVGYNNYLAEKEEVDELILRTNFFPLAIKWAASLAIGRKNLKEVLSFIKQSNNSSKKEFLGFCFSSIYDELTPLSKDCALLIPYLGEKWNQFMLSISLNRPPQEIEDAIFELGDRGILLTSTQDQRKKNIVLPLTIDFLSNKFHENKILKSKISLNISNHLVSNNNRRSVTEVFSEVEKLLDVLKESASILIEKKEYQKSFSIIQLAIRTINDEGKPEIDTKYLFHFKFLEGRMNYENNKIKYGLDIMINAYKKWDRITYHEAFYLGEALLNKGTIDNRDLGTKLVMDNFNKVSYINQSTISELCSYFIEINDKSFVEKILSRINNSNVACFFIQELRDRAIMPDLNSEIYLKDNMKKCLKYALESQYVEEDLRHFVLNYTQNYYR